MIVVEGVEWYLFDAPMQAIHGRVQAAETGVPDVWRTLLTHGIGGLEEIWVRLCNDGVKGIGKYG